MDFPISTNPFYALSWDSSNAYDSDEEILLYLIYGRFRTSFDQ